MTTLTQFWNKLARKRRTPRRQPLLLQLQTLEPRRLLAATIDFDPTTGIVTMTGTGLAETGLVQKKGGTVVVSLQNQNDSLVESFSFRAVNEIVFLGRGGDDGFHNKTRISSTAKGGSGNDKLIGGSGADDLRGGSGNDMIIGRGGDDVLRGDAGDDLLNGSRGNDDLRGGTGADDLRGGKGADILRGGAGNDFLDGGSGADLLMGGDGDDVLKGSSGNDDLRGGDGMDELRGGSGNDVLRGGSENDVLIGGGNNDILLGEGGSDNLRGGPGKDLLIGGEGADTIRGNSESDILIGGTTNYDGNSAKLTAIVDAWVSAPDYSSAIESLVDRDFEFFLRSSETVHDDMTVDRLMGGIDLDWYFDPGSGHHHQDGDHVPDIIGRVQTGEVVDVTLPHAGDPVRQALHFLAMALIPYEIITHTAVNSGNWSESATWADGAIPGLDAHVLVSHDVTVTVDGIVETAHRSVRVDGTLKFATDVNTQLRVETMLVSGSGVLLIGTVAEPVAADVTAVLSIMGNPIDRAFDPTAMGHGLISHGSVEFFGQEKTSHVALASNARKNSTQLVLSEVPVNWKVGDQIVLAGTSKNAQQDELLEIVAIDGNLITFNNPLQYFHSGRNGKSANVANLTRNVQVRSENPDDIGQRGHVMFMHSPNVDVNNAGFYDLGRSDKTTPLHDSVLDDDGNLVDGTGTNQRGRYAVHFHRHGVHNTGNPATVEGSVVFGSPGWGFVNHSSFVEVTNSVAYDVVGAAFVTEGGDEIGTFSGNIAIRGTGSGDQINSRKDVQDFGHQGDGFWLQGPGVAVFDNVAAGHKGNGFVFFTRGKIENGKMTMYLAENLTDPSIANGKENISVANVPLQGFHDNVAYGSKIGAATRFHLLNAKHDQQSVIANLHVWNNGTGLSLPYTNQTVVRNVTVIGNVNNPKGTGINRNNVTRNITFENLHVEGYNIGLYVPRRGDITIVGGYFNNIRNIYIQTAVKPDRTVLITGDVVFGTLSESALRGRTQYRVEMVSNFNPFKYSIEHVFYSDTVTLDFGEFDMQRLYYESQTADSVPFPEPGEFIPPEYVGKTVQELFDEFGLAIGGEIAPDSAISADGIIGLVG